MSLTAAEKATLKASIAADSTLNALPATLDSAFAIAAAYNAPSSPATNIWRSDIAPREVSSVIVMSAFVGLTAIKQNGLLLLTQDIVDATQASVRTAFSDIFGSGPTLTALTALAQRAGTRYEALFSSASGAANVTTKFGQTLSPQDAFDARNS